MAEHLPERGHRHSAHRSRGPPRRDHHHRRGQLPPPCGRGETEVGASAHLPLTRRPSVQIPAVSQVRQQSEPWGIRPYHRPECGFVTRADDVEGYWIEDEAEKAVAEGHEPCAICRPD